MNSNPLISIIIPVYNRADLLGETLDSVLQQTYSNWECIIVDDGSMDGSQELGKLYVNRDSRSKFFPRPSTRKKGASACRNYGIVSSRGVYLQFLDSDDLLDKAKLETQIGALKQKDDKTLSISKWGYFTSREDLEKRLKHSSCSFQNFSSGTELLRIFGKHNEVLPLHSYLTPRKVIESSGGWNEDLSNNDDAEFFTRVLLKTKGVIMEPRAKVYYRIKNQEKLSELDSQEKVLSSINSWKRIEEELKTRGRRKALVYVSRGKRNLYGQTKFRFPEMVKEHYSFFRQVMPLHKRLFKNLM